ncbi:CLUMA_CG014770, isoform A [Clunio marinus]|uniref:CLUMA_CG014770, isoform A n=1 Tax=Clunio marinus TaxID=568069 RepID=A0A1J1IL88_9DIPT|nr:CLUMA_CG014770, isoform A [Clunio marinus]
MKRVSLDQPRNIFFTNSVNVKTVLKSLRKSHNILLNLRLINTKVSEETSLYLSCMTLRSGWNSFNHLYLCVKKYLLFGFIGI